jgi:hypothetical protein
LHAPARPDQNLMDTLSQPSTDGSPQMPYHAGCADYLFVPTCSLCPEKLRGEFYRHPFFLESCYCKTHEGTRKSCFACNRKEPLPASGKEGFSNLTDGRSLCMDCARTAIIDSEEAKPLYLNCVDFMERELGLSIPKGMREVPILAVDLPSLNEQSHNTRAQYHSSAGQANPLGAGVTRGLTLKEFGNVNHYRGGSVYWDPSRYAFVASPSVYRTEEIRSATAVLVLMGLPTDMTASILAHEAFHVWCSLTKDFPFQLPPKVEEGMCQLIAFKYIESIRGQRQAGGEGGGGINRSHSGSAKLQRLPTSDEWDTRLQAFIANQIESDLSPVYGEGFREAAQCYAVLGLDILLQHIKEHKDFPNIH